MLCSLGFDPDRNAYHIIAGYFKQFETIDVLPLQLKLRCACPDSKESLWLLFYKKKQIFKSLASLLTTNKNATEKYRIIGSPTARITEQ